VPAVVLLNWSTKLIHRRRSCETKNYKHSMRQKSWETLTFDRLRRVKLCWLKFKDPRITIGQLFLECRG